MLSYDEYKEIVEIALDRELMSFDMAANFYTEYELNSMDAVVLFVELQRRTGIEISEDDAPSLQTANEIEAFFAAVERR